MSGTYSKLRSQQIPNEQPAKAKTNKQQPTVEQQPERQTRRYSHDLFVDQMDTLKTQTRGYFLLKGESKTVVTMVREAIDGYIKRYQ